MKGKILIVDDELSICDALRIFLTRKGYSVSTVCSGEAALEKIKREDFHFMLLDMKMPGISGLELLMILKESKEKLPIIIMITAVKDDIVGKRCIELGATDYITKPLSLDYLEKVLLEKLSYE